MSDRFNQRLAELCRQIQEEQDQERLIALVRELNQLMQERQQLSPERKAKAA